MNRTKSLLLDLSIKRSTVVAVAQDSQIQLLSAKIATASSSKILFLNRQFFLDKLIYDKFGK